MSLALDRIQVISDQVRLSELSRECEPPGAAVNMLGRITVRE